MGAAILVVFGNNSVFVSGSLLFWQVIYIWVVFGTYKWVVLVVDQVSCFDQGFVVVLPKCWVGQ